MRSSSGTWPERPPLRDVGLIARLLERLNESDETRLAEETRAWAETIEGTVRIAEAPVRQPVRIAGVIRRMTVLPMEGKEALQALISDGTGEVMIVFMGRRGIGGLSLGKRVVVDGVLADHRGEIRMVNPRLEFAG
jgi:RecG-like helicase